MEAIGIRRARFGSRRRVAAASLLLALGSLGAGCGPAEGGAPDVPPLPGVDPDAVDGSAWFWRDVLAAPLPGEAPPRTELLALQPPAARLAALDALLADDDPAALTTLMAALRDERFGIAAAAADGLARLGDTAAIPRLIKGLGPYPVDFDVPIESRAAQAAALARLGNPSGIPLILDLLAEGTALQLDPAELSWTRTTRNAFTQELALPGLVALAGQDFGFHPMESVPAREAAARAARAWWEQQRVVLWSQAPVSGAGLVTRARLLVAHLDAYQLRQIDGARHALTELGPRVLPYLEEGLASDDDYRRLHGLEVMERLCALSDDTHRGRLAVVASGPLLQDAHGGVAAQAARVCGAARVADPLVVALARRPEPEVLVSVLDALGRTGRHAAAEAVLPLADWLARGGPRPRGLHPAADLSRPDASAALAAAAFRLDPQCDPERLLEQLGSDRLDLAFAAIERLVDLTGDDADLDPLAPAAERQPALERARAALTALQRPPPD